MTESGKCQIPVTSSKRRPPSPDSPLRNRRNRHRRKTRDRTFPASGVLPRKISQPEGKRTVPETPLFRWKFGDADPSVRKRPVSGEEKKSRRKGKKEGDVRVSVRKLAATLWHLQLLSEASGSLRGLSKKHPDRLRFELEPSMSFPNPSMEKATKWDPGYSVTTNKSHQFDSRLNFLQHPNISSSSLVSELQAELKNSQAHIHELETERRSSNKKLESFLRKVAEEKASWQRKEHEKLRGVIDGVKNDLKKERKSCQRMEIINTKLVGDLAEAKLCAKRYLQDYEKERKARETLEEVCDELANEIGEDKAEVDSLKRESMAIREVVEEKRKILQMAEVCHEERVQMKLIEAKLALEEKYSEMSRLIDDLESFLRSRNPTLDVVEMRKAELLGEVARSVVTKDIKESSYQPPLMEDIFSVFEDVCSHVANEKDIQPCSGYILTRNGSEVPDENPRFDDFIRSLALRSKNGSIGGKRTIEDGNGWEIVSHGEEGGCSNSADGSNPSVNGLCKESNLSGSGAEQGEKADCDRMNLEIDYVCGASARQSKKKASSISRLWRSYQSGGDNFKTMSVEAIDTRSSGRVSSYVGAGSDKGFGEAGFSPSSSKHWSSPDSGNPHITRGMKGCIEWPRGIQKSSLKSKLLEPRLQSRKVQVRHILKQNT